MKNKAFTLVELIVVITILAILATIAFISFGKYNINSRDTVRVSDIANIKSVLEFGIIDTGKYAIPDKLGEITYSGTMVWKQGTFGKNGVRELKKISKIPLDPLTQNEYTYSVTKDLNKYELSSILEGDFLASQTVSTYLASHKGIGIIGNPLYADETDFKAYILGNYNKYIKLNPNCNIIITPSLITTTTGNQTLEDLIDNNEIVYNGYENLPGSYSGSLVNRTTKNSELLNFINSPEAFTGSCYELKTEAGQRQFIENLQTAYSGTLLEIESGIKEFLEISEDNKLSLAQDIIKANIIKDLKITTVQPILIPTNNFCTFPFIFPCIFNN